MQKLSKNSWQKGMKNVDIKINQIYNEYKF